MTEVADLSRAELVDPRCPVRTDGRLWRTDGRRRGSLRSARINYVSAYELGRNGTEVTEVADLSRADLVDPRCSVRTDGRLWRTDGRRRGSLRSARINYVSAYELGRNGTEVTEVADLSRAELVDPRRLWRSSGPGRADEAGPAGAGGVRG